jgi:flagellar hook-associated protein 3 FlgL
MSSLRVTQGSTVYQSLAGLQSAASRLQGLQSQLSTGKEITKPSDDPAGTVRALQLRGDLKRNTQYASNASDAIGWMTTSDTTYSSIVKQLQQVRSLTVQGLNQGTEDATSSSAIADQIDGIRTSLLAAANTTYNGRPIFGGTTAGSAAYDSSGAFVGDTNAVQRTVGDQSTVQINQTGPGVFGPAGSDVFTLLSDISSALRSTPSTLSGTALTQLDAAVSRVSTAQANEGSTYNRVQQAQTAQASATTSLKTQLSSIQDIDIAEKAVQVTTANTTYQAALQTTASIRQLSLLDFLR